MNAEAGGKELRAVDLAKALCDSYISPRSTG